MEGKENRTLKVKLTDDEVLQRARDLIEADEEIERIDAEKKESAENFAEMKKEQLARKTKARGAVKDGEEDREVECQWEPDWKAKQWLLKRLDTGETIEASTMDADDLQIDTERPDPTRPKQRRRRKPRTESTAGAEGEGDGDQPPPAA